MKSIITFVLLIFLFSCNNSKNTSEIFAPNPIDSIVVYGNLHLHEKMLTDAEFREKHLGEVQETQQWLTEVVSEDIVLVEGMALDSQITEDYLLQYHINGGVNVTPELWADLKSVSQLNDAQMYFSFYTDKKVFGSEDPVRYQKVIDATTKHPELENDSSVLAFRSDAMETNAHIVFGRFGRKIAIIVGYNHLEWFNKRGYTVWLPPPVARHAQ